MTAPNGSYAPARYTDAILGIIQAYAPNGEAQEKVAQMKRDMEGEGCSDGFILQSLAATLHDGLTHGNWPWTVFPKTVKPQFDLTTTQGKLDAAKDSMKDALIQMDIPTAQRAQSEVGRLERKLKREQKKVAVTPESSKHDYEPGSYTAPMQTDPSCRICGGIKQNTVHN